MTSRIFFALVAIFMATELSAQPASGQLSLEEAVALAVAHNRSLANAQGQADKAQADVDTARSRRLPQFSIDATAGSLLAPVDITFPAGAFGNVPGVGPFPETDATVTTPARFTMLVNAQVAQPLTQLFEINLGVRTREAARDIERESVRSGRLEVINAVRRLYYSILRTDSAAMAADEAITLLREVNRNMNERLLRQVVLKNDALDVDMRLAQAEHNRLALRNVLASQKEQLNQLMGRDVRTAFETTGAPAPTIAESDPDSARTQALEGRPEVRQARLRVEQAELNRRIAKADYVPDVSLALSYLSPMNIDGAPTQIANVGVQVQWEPFDWGRRGRTVAARDIEIRQAKNALRDAEDKVLLEVNSSHRRIVEARSLLKVATLARDAATETARVRTSQFGVQAVLLSDVLTAQANLADANNQYQQALLGLWQAGADFEHALGQEVTK